MFARGGNRRCVPRSERDPKRTCSKDQDVVEADHDERSNDKVLAQTQGNAWTRQDEA